MHQLSYEEEMDMQEGIEQYNMTHRFQEEEAYDFGDLFETKENAFLREQEHIHKKSA